MIHVLVKTIWGELLSIDCHENDSVENIALMIHELFTEEFPKIPLVKREKEGPLHEGEILCLIPYPQVNVEISLLSDAVFGDFGPRNGDHPVMAMYELYDAKIETGHGFFYLPFLVFTFHIPKEKDHPTQRLIYELFLPSFRPLNQAGFELFQKMSEHSSAFRLGEGDWEDGPILVDGELVHATDPWVHIDPTHFQQMSTIGTTLAQECMGDIVEERAYMEAYLKWEIDDKWKKIEKSRY